MASEHTVRAYDDELRQLTNSILEMGGRVETQIQAAIDAVTKRDSSKADSIVAADQPIDDLEVAIEQQVTRLVALRQPMAQDLRHIIAALRIANDLERMGDLAKNIAKRTIALAQTRELPTLWAIPHMAESVQGMVKEVLDGFNEQDIDKLSSVWQRDEDVDQVYTGLFRELITYMIEDPRNITGCIHLLFVAKNLERIADHATNMAETIFYQFTGDRMPTDRPKADMTPEFAGHAGDTSRQTDL